MAQILMNKNLVVMDAEIGSRPFVAGDAPSVADCTLYATVSFIRQVGLAIPEELENINRWEQTFSTRPSASA